MKDGDWAPWIRCRLKLVLGILFVASQTLAIPREYLTGETDPPRCKGEPNTNPFPGQCGQRRLGFNQKRDVFSSDIVGGRPAGRAEFPWYANIGGCGATVFDPLHLLTAAHCLENDNRIGDIVFIGADKPYKKIIRSDDPSDYCGVQVRKVVETRTPPSFCSNDMFQRKKCPVWLDYDLTVLELNRPLEYDARVQPACLPTSNPASYIAPGTPGVVVGTGYTDYDTQTVPDQLQTVSVPILDRETCAQMMDKHNKITERMFCAGYKEGGKDACVGDSGGPLFNLRTQKAVLVGVVSWGVKCAEAVTPGVYTRIDKFFDFIGTAEGDIVTSSGDVKRQGEDNLNTAPCLRTPRNFLIGVVVAWIVTIIIDI